MKGSASTNRLAVSVANFEEEMRPIDSPRTLEACLRSGFDPNDLFPRPTASFKQRGEAAAVTKIKAEHFEEKRKERIRMVQGERDTIIKYLSQSTSQASIASMESKDESMSAAAQIKAQMQNQTSTMMQMEQDRLRRIQERMGKELKGIVTQEEKVAKIQQANKDKEEQERLRKIQMEKERKKRASEEAAKKREKQLQKQKEEEDAEKKRRDLQKTEAARERSIAEQEAKEAKKRLAAARRNEIERRAKQEEHRKQVEEKLAAQEEAAHQSRLRMEEQERMVQQMMLDKKIALAEKIQQKRMNAEKRIDSALKSNQDIMRRKKEMFDEKQKKAHERAGELEETHQQDLKKQGEKRQKEHDLAKARKDAAYEQEEDRVADIVAKREMLDGRLTQVYHKREKKREIRAVRKDMNKSDKWANVQRIKRVDEFVRLQTLQKIQDDDDRSNRIKKEKQQLLEQRKMAALQSLMQKHKITTAMDQMRISNKWGSLDKLIDGGSSSGKKRKKNKNADSLPTLPRTAPS